MEYRPLNTDRNEIRLLTLQPGDESTIVQCTLEHISLINPPEYCALSYCWGDPIITIEIIVNKTSVQVTTNLELALRRLRDKGYTCFWVDAICINQQDKVEKNQQLFWMGSIYRRAKEVHAWIGKEDDDSNEVLDTISAEAFDLANPIKVTKLMKLLERPYWRRVWVIQELALARHSIVHCGLRSISWKNLATTVESKMLNTLSPTLANIRNLVQFHLDATSIKPLRLLIALSRTCSSLATDPRDKVFALLGLVYDSGYYIPVPNYNQSLRDLCVSMTLSAISTTYSLDLIAFLGSGCNNTSGLPSWTPNWFELNEISSKRQCAYIVDGAPISRLNPWFHPSSDYDPNKGHWYHASGNTKASFVMNSEVLQLRGSIFDTVDGVCPTLFEIGENFHFPREWQSTSEGRNCYESAWEDIVYTLTRYFYNPAPDQPDFRKKCYEFFELCWHEKTIENWRGSAVAQVVSWITKVESFVVQGQTLKERAMKLMNKGTFKWTDDGFTDHSDYYYRDSKLTLVLRDINAVLNDNMRFMTTKKGYVGWAHPRSQKGDIISILEGCSVPVILRARAEGDFIFVGDAYVRGIMEGQEMERDGGVDWREIRIH